MLMMPKSLDVLIGLAVVMLVVSMTVTMLTQAIPAYLIVTATAYLRVCKVFFYKSILAYRASRKR